MKGGGGLVAMDELKTWEKGGTVLGQRGPVDLWRQTTGTTTKRRRGRNNLARHTANLFITTAPSLSPSRTANANVGHLGKK